MIMKRTLVALAAVTAVVATAAPAHAGPWDGVTAWETATVKRIVDGDTLIVTDDVTGAQSRIRLLGINSPEAPHGANPGQCGGWQATEALKGFLPVGTKVRLLSADPTSKGKANRPQRVVLAYSEATKEFDLDIAWAMAERGWGLWYTVAKEAAMSSLYRQVIERAQERRQGMWNPQLCGEPDQPDANIELRINRGNPTKPLNDEYVVVKNRGAAPVDISGWVVRDSGNQAWFQFPGGSVLAPDDYRVVHTGAGTPALPQPRDLYVGHRSRLYTAAGQGPALLGDGAYLLDKYGNFRFWREYPCTTQCDDDPYSSAIIIDDFSLGEKKGKKRAQTQWVRIKNRGTVTHCLDTYRIETGNTRYSFQPGTCLAPGSTWTLNVGRPPRGALVDYSTADFLRSRTPALWASGSVSLLTDQDRVIAKRSW
jgi:endonuclease YncB( thermonuclease family)